MVLVPYFLPGGGISGEGAPVPSHNASSPQQDENEKLVLDGANEEIVKECAQSITDLRGCIRKQEAEVKEKQDQIRSLLDACQVGINEFTNDEFTAQDSLDYHRRTLDILKAFGEDFESIIDSMLQTQRKVVFNILSIHLSSIKAIQCDDAPQKDINENKAEQVASLQAEIADPKATIANHESEKEALQETINSQQSDIEELADYYLCVIQ